MAPYLAVFVGEQGQQVTTSLYTKEEFKARAAIPGTKWATLLDTNTGQTVLYGLTESPSSEKTA